jgi:SulP family sulfate permease
MSSSIISKLTNDNFLKPNIVAGFSVAVLTIPQAVAYATLAGLPPQYGLYAATFPSLIAAIAGSSNFLVTGPAALTSLLTFTSLSLLFTPFSSDYIGAAVLLAAMVGIIHLILTVFNLGALIKFISQPVILGFTNAAAIIIILTQIPKLFGLPTSSINLASFNSINPLTLLFGLIPLIVILFVNFKKFKYPMLLTSIIMATLLSYVLDYQGLVVGLVPAGLPQFSIPTLDLQLIKALFVPAIFVTIISFMSSATVAKSLATKTLQLFNPNQELLSQGLANLTSSFFGSFPVAGSLARSALNYSSGATHWISTLFSSLFIFIALLFFTPLLYYLPQATLAAIIIATVLNLINIKEPLYLLRSRHRDGLVFIITFLTTLIFNPHLEYGIAAGIGLSILLHMQRTSRPQLQFFFLKPGKKDYAQLHFKTIPNNYNMLAVTIDWSLSFANANYFYDSLMDQINSHTKVRYVLIMSRGIHHIDYTAEEILHQLSHDLSQRNINLLFSGFPPHVKEKLEKTHLFSYISPNSLFDHASDAIAYVNQQEK